MKRAEHLDGIKAIAGLVGRVAEEEALKLYDKLSGDEIRRFEGPQDNIPFPRNGLAFGRILVAAVLHRLPREVEAEDLLRDIKAARRIERHRP